MQCKILLLWTSKTHEFISFREHCMYSLGFHSWMVSSSLSAAVHRSLLFTGEKLKFKKSTSYDVHIPEYMLYCNFANAVSCFHCKKEFSNAPTVAKFLCYNKLLSLSDEFYIRYCCLFCCSISLCQLSEYSSTFDRVTNSHWLDDWISEHAFNIGTCVPHTVF